MGTCMPNMQKARLACEYILTTIYTIHQMHLNKLFEATAYFIYLDKLIHVKLEGWEISTH